MAKQQQQNPKLGTSAERAGAEGNERGGAGAKPTDNMYGTHSQAAGAGRPPPRAGAPERSGTRGGAQTGLTGSRSQLDPDSPAQSGLASGEQRDGPGAARSKFTPSGNEQDALSRRQGGAPLDASVSQQGGPPAGSQTQAQNHAPSPLQTERAAAEDGDSPGGSRPTRTHDIDMARDGSAESKRDR